MKRRISILLPTRNRFEHLSRFINSAISLASEPNSIEILLKIDNDDINTIDNLDKLPYQENLIFVYSDKMGGYDSLADFMNMLYERSSGDWIYLAGDDSVIKTPEWDKLFYQYDNQFVCLNHLPTYPNGETFNFPIISRKIAEVIGHVTQAVFFDSYLMRLTKEFSLVRHIPLQIEHLHDKLKDELTEEKTRLFNKWRNEKTWDLRDSFGELEKDKQKIREYLKR
jgi:hypothetical protein